jgi:chaperonin cofactor prefoldin
MTEKIIQLQLQRRELRASIDLQEGLIAQAHVDKYNAKDVKAAAQFCSKLEHERKELREQEDDLSTEIEELKQEAREAARDARHAKRQGKAEKNLDRDLELMVSSIDKVVTAFEKLVDDKRCAERVGDLMAKVAGASASAFAKCEKAAKEATEKEKPTPSMTTV